MASGGTEVPVAIEDNAPEAALPVVEAVAVAVVKVAGSAVPGARDN
jgi:hypothetical protein